MKTLLRNGRLWSALLAAALCMQAHSTSVQAESPRSTDAQALLQSQAAEIKGRVADENGEPIFAALVRLKGTEVQTLTDANGRFSLTVPKDFAGERILLVSSLGFKAQEVAATDGEMSITLESNAREMDEVVVTALGIKREKKMLGYAVQDIKSDALNTTGDPSVTSALEGKVAGLQMNTASTGLGGSVKITLRGNSSLTDNNQPLWVVDGVPFSDNQRSSASAYGGYDRGGTSFDLNPDDIESISVLKGANAAALYGARAGNGVIYITTKRGARKKGFGVDYSGSFTWSQVSQTLPMQRLYGQGSRGQAVYLTDEEGNPVAMTSELAFGPALDGTNRLAWTGETMPYTYAGDKLKDYFHILLSGKTHLRTR